MRIHLQNIENFLLFTFNWIGEKVPVSMSNRAILSLHHTLIRIFGFMEHLYCKPRWQSHLKTFSCESKAIELKIRSMEIAEVPTANGIKKIIYRYVFEIFYNTFHIYTIQSHNRQTIKWRKCKSMDLNVKTKKKKSNHAPAWNAFSQNVRHSKHVWGCFLFVCVNISITIHPIYFSSQNAVKDQSTTVWVWFCRWNFYPCHNQPALRVKVNQGICDKRALQRLPKVPVTKWHNKI